MTLLSAVRLKQVVGIGGLLVLLAVGEASGSVLATYEPPGVLTTSVSGASVVTFDALPLGVDSNVPFMNGALQIGTFDLVHVYSGSPYGGANGSQYITPVDPGTTLTLVNPAAYFGIWWSAGDPSNVIDFYSGSALVAQFTTANILQDLPNTYKGNPSGPYKGDDPGEPYAYLNFFGQGGTTWDRMVFSNGQFESDNYASRTAPWNPGVNGPFPGVVFESINGSTETPETAPEPATLGFSGVALMALAFAAHRLRR